MAFEPVETFGGMGKTDALEQGQGQIVRIERRCPAVPMVRWVNIFME